MQAKIQDFIKEGKYEELSKLGDPPKNLGPFVYPPEKAFTDAYNAEQKDRDDQARALESKRRSVEFAIYANRTPTATAPKFHPKPTAILAGHPLWRQDEGKINGPTTLFLDLAVSLGPPKFEMPQVLIAHKELAVKTIVVWAFLQTRDDTTAADEAVVRKIMEFIDYQGLAKLIVR